MIDLERADAIIDKLKKSGCEKMDLARRTAITIEDDQIKIKGLLC